MKFAHLVDVNDFVNWCDYLGTLAFAISGIRLAAGKGLDWFGAYVVGFVTAVGGGTIRDILLDIKPFWARPAILSDHHGSRTYLHDHLPTPSRPPESLPLRL